MSFLDGRVNVKVYVSMMLNAIPLRYEDWLSKHFLQRYLSKSQEPETCPIVVDNMGFKPKGVSAATDLRVGKFRRMYPGIADKNCKMVGGLGLTDEQEEIQMCKVDGVLKETIADVPTAMDAKIEAAEEHSTLDLKDLQETEEFIVLEDTGTKKKKLISEDKWSDIEINGLTEVLEDSELERVLKVEWRPGEHVSQFSVYNNLHLWKKKSRLGPNLSNGELQANPVIV